MVLCGVVTTIGCPSNRLCSWSQAGTGRARRAQCLYVPCRRSCRVRCEMLQIHKQTALNSPGSSKHEYCEGEYPCPLHISCKRRFCPEGTCRRGWISKYYNTRSLSKARTRLREPLCALVDPDERKQGRSVMHDGPTLIRNHTCSRTAFVKVCDHS